MGQENCRLLTCSYLADRGTQDAFRELFANIFLLPHQREEYYKMSSEDLTREMALAIKIVREALNESHAEIFWGSMAHMGNEYLPYSISQVAQPIARAMLINRIFDELIKQEETKNV